MFGPVLEADASNLSRAIPVHRSAGAVDGVEGLAEIAGDRVGGGGSLPSSLDLDGAVAGLS